MSNILFLIVILFLGGLIGLAVSLGLNARRRHKTDWSLDVNNALNMAVDIIGNHVMRFDLKRNNVYDLHGRAIFGNNVTMEHCYTYIHPDDLPAFRGLVERLSKGQSREGSCRYRWDYNYTGHGDPDWHNMYMQVITEYDEDEKPAALIATLIDETETLRKIEEERQLSERFRLIFENSIVALSFYSADGRLLDANAMMRKLCNFDSDTFDEFYSNNNLFDLAPFSEVIDRENVVDQWYCAQSIVPERDMHYYLEIHSHPIFDDSGKLIYISLTVRDVTEERQMYLQARENDVQLQEANKSIGHYEKELNYMMESCELQAWRITLAENRIDFYKGLNTVDASFTLQQLLTIFVDQDDPFVRSLANPVEFLSEPKSHICQMHPIVSHRNGPQWVQINFIPEYDADGRLKGAFGLYRNITKLMSKQDELRRETERASESGHMKSVFLANMTHEIRTPLNAIVGFSDLLQAVESEDDRKEMLRVIHNNCDMLLRLINDILVLSNVDANAMEIRYTKTDFARFFDDVCQSLAQRISEPGVEFQKDNPYTSLMVNIDDSRIQQVITNFVTNAVKYTHQGHIKVGYRLEERNGLQGIYVYCEDTGEGIPEDQLGRVFERFVKLNDYIQGTGLGLSICKAIIDKCNGVIGVESVEGKGSTFWFWIPVEVLSPIV